MQDWHLIALHDPGNYPLSTYVTYSEVNSPSVLSYLRRALVGLNDSYLEVGSCCPLITNIHYLVDMSRDIFQFLIEFRAVWDIRSGVTAI